MSSWTFGPTLRREQKQERKRFYGRKGDKNMVEKIETRTQIFWGYRGAGTRLNSSVEFNRPRYISFSLLPILIVDLPMGVRM